MSDDTDDLAWYEYAARRFERPCPLEVDGEGFTWQERVALLSDVLPLTSADIPPMSDDGR